MRSDWPNTVVGGNQADSSVIPPRQETEPTSSRVPSTLQLTPGARGEHHRIHRRLLPPLHLASPHPLSPMWVHFILSFCNHSLKRCCTRSGLALLSIFFFPCPLVFTVSEVPSPRLQQPRHHQQPILQKFSDRVYPLDFFLPRMTFFNLYSFFV